MTASPHFTHPTYPAPRPHFSTDIAPPPHSPSQAFPATPFDATIQVLTFEARVPMPGMHSSNHASDSMRTHLHLPNSRVIDVEPLDPIEFDGIPIRSPANQTSRCEKMISRQ